VTKFAPHKALKLITPDKVTFDRRVVVHRGELKVRGSDIGPMAVAEILRRNAFEGRIDPSMMESWRLRGVLGCKVLGMGLRV